MFYLEILDNVFLHFANILSGNNKKFRQVKCNFQISKRWKLLSNTPLSHFSIYGTHYYLKRRWNYDHNKLGPWKTKRKKEKKKKYRWQWTLCTSLSLRLYPSGESMAFAAALLLLLIIIMINQTLLLCGSIWIFFWSETTTLKKKTRQLWLCCIFLMF